MEKINKPRNYMEMASQKWNEAFDSQKDQLSAFKDYLRYFMLKPPEIIHAQTDDQAIMSTLLTLPITIPAAVLTSPLFFVARTKLAIEKKIQQHDNKIVQQMVSKFYHQKTKFFTQVKAYQQAISNKLIQNKKRLIILYAMQKDSQRDKGEKEFMAVAGEDEMLMGLIVQIRNRVYKQNQRESIHLFHNSRVISPSTRVNKLLCDELGVVRMGYVFIETFG